MSKKNLKSVKTTVYFVIESCAGTDCATCGSGGWPTFYKSEKEAKKYIASLAKAHELERGQNDGEKWADYRWDRDDSLAWIDADGYFWKAELFTREIEIKVAA